MMISATIRSRIGRFRRGEPFTSRELLALGSRASVDQTLSRLVRQGVISRVSRGIYVKPKKSAILGEMPVPAARIAEAVARAEGTKLQVSGAEAANLLGVSTQTPVRKLYLTNGPSRKIRVGKQEIELRRASPAAMAGAGTEAGLVISAFRYLGKELLTEEMLEKVGAKLPLRVRKQLSAYETRVPGWMLSPLKRLAARGRQTRA